MGVRLARIAIAGFGLLALIGGAAVVALAGPAGFIGGAILFLTGAVLLAAAALERMRYRSEATEPGPAAFGPGGGEPEQAAIEPRFEPTAEVFVDPTTRQRMRVLVDRRTGERRYVADG
jgi:hypothetical protein